MDKNNLVSIAMATYNGEKYLKEQLDSIYGQTYKNIEVIVTDDCSTDKTVEILEQYAKSYGLKYYVNEKNLGFVKNFEKAISLCNGEYIALADQDDVWDTTKLDVLYKNIGNNLLIHSDCMIIDEENRVLQPYWKRDAGYNILIENLIFQNVVTGCTLLFKKELLETALPFPNGIVYHDWWLAMCAAEKTRIHYIPNCLSRYRQHDKQDTGMVIKSFILNRVFKDIVTRLKKKNTIRYIGCLVQIKQLEAIKKDNRCLIQNSTIIDDAIEYASNYINNKIHLKTFFVGIRYSKYIYPHRNYLYVKNFLLDIVG